MNGRKARDQVDLAMPRQLTMDKRRSPSHRQRRAVGPAVEHSGHVGRPTLSLLTDGGAGRACRWILARARGVACHRPVGDGVRNRTLGRGDTLRI
jgi:hypothetical protein